MTAFSCHFLGVEFPLLAALCLPRIQREVANHAGAGLCEDAEASAAYALSRPATRALEARKRELWVAAPARDGCK
jgi:hypothetical protein